MAHFRRKTESKRKYIEAWDEHIDQLGTLRFTSDRELSEEIGKKQEELKVLVRKIADTKQFRWDKVKK